MSNGFKRIMAIILVAALIGTMIISVVVSAIGGSHDPHAGHDHANGVTDEYEFAMELMEDEQALRVTQRLTFYNASSDSLDRVMFAVYANMFRRETTVMYSDPAALPYGFNPGGVEFYSVKVNGEEAEWAVQGDGEYFMRVACALEPGESADFEFVYDALITRNAAFLGVDQGCWRLSGFYPVLCAYNDGVWEGNPPLEHSRYTLTTPAAYSAEITLPGMYALAGTGAESRVTHDDGRVTWFVHGENIREFALTIGRAWRVHDGRTAAGLNVNVLSADRSGGPEALEIALEALEACGEMFGGLPYSGIDIVETDIAGDMLAFAGCIWIDREVFREGGDRLKYAVRKGIAEQYFGIGVYADPVGDAWLGESVSEYAVYMLWEKLDGKAEFEKRMNIYFIDAINVTIPSNVFMNSDAALFTPATYETVVRHRGAMALHELRVAMGDENFTEALRTWYARHGGGNVADETDFLKTISDVSGRDWEKFLTELIYNIDEYSNQYLDWYE